MKDILSLSEFATQYFKDYTISRGYTPYITCVFDVTYPWNKYLVYITDEARNTDEYHYFSRSSFTDGAIFSREGMKDVITTLVDALIDDLNNKRKNEKENEKNETY